ncbi:ragulator complex protein LAMTOR3 [Octopus vulgaris]|uniref:Ragulator complex protein LAMTOR3 n=3 Tax=Octopus TaxID=6643 RepID=A0AA36F774_OCTVU|nr:ragulator complex protein LAMTOR3-B [Octopus bimaculoides]XP_029639904.1 ragulator complex protein LAMTOR3-B [Octopus sinensis]CAI9726874.1 ragulator complex protein LAMTOR3 [Octopus vulgaris]|eukprot:XP_014779137.1 PREDICTED: ragulator complex protein LAMTOR3-B-like [Octopus bimaculoides]
MAEELKRYLMQLKNSVAGLNAIIITDRDGVPVLKVADDNAPELVMKQNFLSTFGLATEQAGKLGLSENRSVISMYTTCQIIQINHLPFLITLVASINANTGMLLNVPNEMQEILKDLDAVLTLV